MTPACTRCGLGQGSHVADDKVGPDDHAYAPPAVRAPPACASLFCSRPATGTHVLKDGRVTLACDAYRDPPARAEGCVVLGCQTPVAPGSHRCAAHPVGWTDAGPATGGRVATPTPRIPHPPVEKSTGAPPHTPVAFPGRCDVVGCLGPVKHVGHFLDGGRGAVCGAHEKRLASAVEVSLTPPPSMAPKTDRPDFCRHSERPESCWPCRQQREMDERVREAHRRIEMDAARENLRPTPGKVTENYATTKRERWGTVQSEVSCFEDLAREAGVDVSEGVSRVLDFFSPHEKTETPPVITAHFAMGVLEQGMHSGSLHPSMLARARELVRRMEEAWLDKPPVVLPPLCHGQMERLPSVWRCAGCAEGVGHLVVEAAARRNRRVVLKDNDVTEEPMPRSTP